MENLVRGDCVLCANNHGLHGATTDSNQNMLRSFACTVRQFNRMRIRDACTAIKGFDTCVLEQITVDPLKAIQLSLHLFLKGSPIEPFVRHIPAVSLRFFCQTCITRCEHHQFFGNTATNDASAAIAIFLGQRDLRTRILRCYARRTHSARAATNYKQIVVKCHSKVLKSCAAALSRPDR